MKRQANLLGADIVIYTRQVLSSERVVNITTPLIQDITPTGGCSETGISGSPVADLKQEL
jgi:hypothetical protein